MVFLLIGYLTLVAYVFQLVLKQSRFSRDRDAVTHRIHVNGIRGKSTVTRYIAAILRDAGFETYGKTTGTAARVILPDGRDAHIVRRGFPNVNEQLGMIRTFSQRGAQAIVMECMAINPDYQAWLEEKVMHSQIVVITNVRLDHQEEMGRELTDIARSLSRSIPHNGILITAETNRAVLTILRQECKRKGSRMVRAKSALVAPAELRRFGHVAHAQNVAIGLAVAEVYGITRAKALSAMVAAQPDPGAFRVRAFRLGGKTVRWANLFAVNDKESFAEIARNLAADYPDHQRVALLNNRMDRPARVEMFAKLAQRALRSNVVVALGDYERQVQAALDTSKTTFLAMGNTSVHAKSAGRTILLDALANTSSDKVLLVGAVNIHTPQSEGILEFLAHATREATRHVDAPRFVLQTTGSLRGSMVAQLGAGSRWLTRRGRVSS